MKNKEQLIQEHLEATIKPGEQVYIRGLGSQDKNAFHNTTEVVRVEQDGIIYINHKSEYKVNFEDVKKVVYDIGVDPFNEDLWRKVQNVNFNLSSVLFKLGIGEEKSNREAYTTDLGYTTKACNFNPFVCINREKNYYQRPFVWTLEEQQSLVHSIYNRMACGKIVVRERGFKWVMESKRAEDECYWMDVVDGKQRLTTIQRFMNNEFCDGQGNYWKDLSDITQHKFLDHQLFSYCEMSERVSDKDVLKQFLSINFAGVPQSKEHIQYVESLLKPQKI